MMYLTTRWEKFAYSFLGVLVLAAGCSATGRVISPERYRAHIAVLANDQLEGRETGTHGIDLAAGYIAGQFEAAGLQPGGPGGTYFQDFTISQSARLLDETRFTVLNPQVDAALRTDFIPLGFSTAGSFEGEVAFVGYGIVNPAKERDDYAGLDVSKRVVLMIRREPPGWGGEERFTEDARFSRKLTLAAEHGAAAVLIVNPVSSEPGSDDLEPFDGGGDTFGLPAVQITRKLADQLLVGAGMPEITELQRRIVEERRQVSAILSGVQVKGQVAYEAEGVTARNVIGVLPGHGPHADQYIVVGGHYDHLGVKKGQIHNGADDNASGTSGVIELARTLAQTTHRDRSVIFMTFTGEEWGLYGSQHFTQNPTVPLSSIVAMLNMDMIGHLNTKSEANMLGIHGLGTGDGFKALVNRHARELGLTYIPQDSGRGPSDHAPFNKEGVPTLFFFTGLHPDYHRPGDDLEKVNAPGGAMIVEMIYRIALDLLNAGSVPRFVRIEERARIPGRTRFGDGDAVLEVVPTFDEEKNGAGWRIEGAYPGGGAAKAGLRKGDRITFIKDQPIQDFWDYQDAVAASHAGDVVPITVQRGSKTLNLQVKLSVRGG